jgi:hypothetical protein
MSLLVCLFPKDENGNLLESECTRNVRLCEHSEHTTLAGTWVGVCKGHARTLRVWVSAK